MTYVLFFTRSHGQEKSLLYYDLFRLWSSILKTRYHPHSLVPLLPPHPYTHHPDPCNTAPLEEGHATAQSYGEEGDLECMVEDYVQPKLGPAKVGLVLPSTPSVQQVGRCYREPLPDQTRFGRQ